MMPQDWEDRLSRISTRWTLIRQAHGENTNLADAAMVRMIEKYSGSVYRYLLAVLRDQDAADEVFQQFALRTVQGAFRRADPERGRFRDYLKISVLRLVTDHHRGKKMVFQERPIGGAEDVAAPTATPVVAVDEFENSWRDELLALAWNSLQTLEKEGGRPYHSVLDHRSRAPEATSAEMAADLTTQLRPDKPYTDVGIRKTLQRARRKFAEFLLHEVEKTLDNADTDAIEQELIDLGLHSYCRSAIARRRG